MKVVDLDERREKEVTLIFACECGCKYFNMIDYGAECIVCEKSYPYHYIDETLREVKAKPKGD